MKQENKNRTVRALLIFAVLSALAVGFMFQYFQGEDKVKPPLVSIIHSEDERKHPMIGVVKEVNDEVLLGLYKIIPEDKYKLEMMAVTQLSMYPDEMVPTKNQVGLWLQFNENWHYFNEQLENTKQTSSISYQKPKFLVESVRENDNFHSVARYQGEVLWENDFSEKPHSIHLLSQEKNHWIVVFSDEISILK